MNSTKLFLEVDTSQIDIKKILKKDFLELSMRAISSANPNRNNSWFTKESMEKSLHSFINKPVLGYFENGDFVSHNGDWVHDSETDMDYWDTLGSKGERILGTIRESDEVKIVEDSDGLSWVVFTCVLWTQYCFKQVKRLLKDAKRAQQTGESAKNISVEVDITDYEILENGVMKINEFNLVGVTILGSRNFIKVEPGIENAELSVTDIMGRDVYSKQEQALRLAYEKLDSPMDGEKKEDINMEVEVPTVESVQETDKLEDIKNNEDAIQEPLKEGFEEENLNTTEEHEVVEEGAVEEHLAEHFEETETETETETYEEHNDVNPVRDVAWLISDCSWNIESLQCTIEYYENSDHPAKDYVIGVLQRIIARQHETEKELGDLLSKIVNGVTDADILYEEKIQKYGNMYELIEQYEALEKDGLDCHEQLENVKQTLNEKTELLNKYEHEHFMLEAKEMINNAHIQDEQIIEDFVNKCEQYEINNLEDLKIQVAVYAFDNSDHVSEEIPPVSPVVTPDVTTAFDKKKAVKSNNDPWGTLHEYINNN